MKCICEYCGRTFLSPEECLRHEAIHEGKESISVIRIDVLPDEVSPELNIYHQTAVMDFMGQPYVIRKGQYDSYSAYCKSQDDVIKTMNALMQRVNDDLLNEETEARKVRLKTVAAIAEKMVAMDIGGHDNDDG